MKKLLTLCLLMAATLAITVQEKPSKEKTIAFMRGVLESSIGQPYHGNHVVTQVSFDGDSYKNTLQNIHYKNDFQFIEYRAIKWEHFSSVSTEKTLEGVVDFNVWFDVKIENIHDNGKSFSEIVQFLIPVLKKESFKKACLRLSEIAKEENKDPFAN